MHIIRMKNLAFTIDLLISTLGPNQRGKWAAFRIDSILESNGRVWKLVRITSDGQEYTVLTAPSKRALHNAILSVADGVHLAREFSQFA